MVDKFNLWSYNIWRIEVAKENIINGYRYDSCMYDYYCVNDV